MAKGDFEQMVSVTIKKDDDLSFYATVKLKFVHDPKWGADADGNRGVPRDILNDFEIVKVIDSIEGNDIMLLDWLESAIEKKVVEGDYEVETDERE